MPLIIDLVRIIYEEPFFDKPLDDMTVKRVIATGEATAADLDDQALNMIHAGATVHCRYGI